MSGFAYKPIKNGSIFVYNPSNFLRDDKITKDQLLTLCYNKSQCDQRYISATGDAALFFLDLYNSATVSNVIDWNKPLRVNNFVFPSSGKGLELAFHAASNVGLILSYDRTANQYYDLKMNDCFTIKQNGTFRFGTGNNNSVGTLSLGNVSDNALALTWDSNANSYAMFGTDANGSLRIISKETLASRVSQFVFSSRGYMKLNNSSSSYSITSLPRCPLDFGSSANSCMINLFKQTIDTAPFYGFGANNVSIEYHSPGDHKWYYNTTHTESTLTTTLGTNTMTLTSLGNLTVAGRLASSNDVVAYSGNIVGLSGPMARMYYSGGKATFIGYDYSTLSYKHVQLGASTFVYSQTGTNFTGLTVNNPADTGYAFPLAVYGTATYSKTGGFGYLSSSGSSTATNFTGRAFTIYSQGGILCDGGEIDVFSDRRMKKNIQVIDSDIAKKFLELDPVMFQYNTQDDTDTHYHYSYIAQQVVQKGVPHIVGYGSLNNEIQLEPETIQCDDGSVAQIDGETKFTMNLLACVPYLHKIIQLQEEQIEANKVAIAELKARLNM